MRMADESDQDSWKLKYYATLERLEARERSARETEQFLRRSLGRLALISHGVDAVLDSRLGELRKALSRDEEVAHLTALVEDVAARVKLLDESGRGIAQRQTSAVDVLGQIIDALTFPPPCRKRAQALRKRLNGAEAEAQTEALIGEFARLVIEAMQIPVGAESEQEAPGLLARLFQRRKPAAAEEAPPIRGTVAETESGRQPVPVNRGRADQSAVFAAAAELSGISLPALRDLFLEFLDSLSFPPAFSDKVQLVRDMLLEGFAVDEVRSVTHSVVALVAEMRNTLGSEKHELEVFLHSLTERLRELDSLVDGAETQRRAAVESGRRLGEAVDAQVSDIERTVNSATDLNQMKTMIQGSLENIRQHLAEQRRQEEARQLELEAQLKQMTSRVSDMEQESSQLRQRLEQERIQATTDPLTGVPNRLAFDQRMMQESARWERYGGALTLLLCDIDYFKRINDTYGHKAGDKALRVIANTLARHLRASDFLARVGGEEFAVILPETAPQAAEKVAEKLRWAVQSCEFVYQGKPVPITISGGYSQFGEGDKPDDVYQRADAALYEAKRAGRNRMQAG